MAREGILFGYGNPLLDISVIDTEEKILKKYDLKPDNAILAEEKHNPMFQEMIDTFKDDVQFIPGGATQNSIKIAQWLIGHDNATTFMGCIGKDKYGEILSAKCKELGVNVRYQYHDTVKTGTCAVIISGAGSRSLCAALDAANHFTKDHIDKPENWEYIERAQYYYISSFPLTVSPPTILAIAKHACDNNKAFTMNLSAPFLCQFFKEPMMQVMPYVDVVFGNETEADTFAKEHNFGTEDTKEIALKIAALDKANKERSRMVVITQGDKPTVVAKDGKTTEFKVIPIKGEDIVDTNGAGDAFVGGFLAQYVQDQSIDRCIACGHYAANLIIQRSGCTFPEKPNFS